MSSPATKAAPQSPAVKLLPKRWHRRGGPAASRPQSKAHIKFPLHMKFIASISVLMGLLMLAVITLVGSHMRQSILDEFLKRGLSVARNLAAVNTNYVSTYNYINIEQSVDYVVKENDLLYATVLFFDGEAAAYSGRDDIKARVLDGALHQRAFGSQETLIHYGEMGDETFCEIAVPIFMDGQKWGTVRVGFPLDGMQHAILETRRTLIWLGSLALLGGCMAALFLARRIARPMGTLVQSVEAIANGNYENTIQTDSKDEIGYFARRFGSMQETIKQNVRLLTEANNDLSEANQQLRHEIKERRLAEKALLRRDAILKAVSYASERFLKESRWEDSIQEVLRQLGQATGMRRIWISQQMGGHEGDERPRPCFAWRLEEAGQAADQNGPEAAGVNLAGEQTANATEQTIPIYVREGQWGLLAYEIVASGNLSPLTSTEALKTVAGNLGAAIQRKMDLETLKLANRAKDDFLANMSHELRTPLNHIIGFTELVADKHFGDLNATQEEYLGDVLASSKHLLALINDVLDLSKVEAGKVELRLVKVHLNDMLRNSMTILKEKAFKHNIQMETDFEHIPAAIYADERKLKQVLYNLLSNAMKFTPDGGQVLLAAKTVQCYVRTGMRKGDHKDQLFINGVEQRQVEASAQLRSCVEISVTDTGIGLRDKDLKRIFNRFDQVESSTTRKYQGTGLGLALAKSLVELHGGRIWAESKGENHGSTFRFVIPA